MLQVLVLLSLVCAETSLKPAYPTYICAKIFLTLTSMYIADGGLQKHPLRQSLPRQLLLPSFLLQSVLKDAVHLLQSQLVPNALDTATPHFQSHPFVNSGDSFRQQGLFVPTKPRAFSCIRGGLVPFHVSSFNVNTSYSLVLGRSTVCPSYHQILDISCLPQGDSTASGASNWRLRRASSGYGAFSRPSTELE